MSTPLPGMADAQVERLIAALESLTDGELAVPMLIACGDRAVPYLEHFLLTGSPRTIALPRCRAVHALGELGAYSTLISYFHEYDPPGDAAVLFAEDAVRSAVARELLRWKSDEVFQVLMDAAIQRATSGITLALGEFHRAESIPLLFELLEDDLCREEAKDGLRKVAEAAHPYAILLIRGMTDLQIRGPGSLRRRRATLQLLDEFGVTQDEWQDIRQFLFERDADVVIAAATIGSRITGMGDQQGIVHSLFRISGHLNWAQEDHVCALLESNHETACTVARAIVNEKRSRGEQPNWLNPAWRILRHVLGPELGQELESGHYGAA